MTSTAFDDQFAECTPEEDEAFRAIAERRREVRDINKRLEEEAVNALRGVVCPYTEDAIVTARDVYTAIRDGEIPGVVLGAPHE